MVLNDYVPSNSDNLPIIGNILLEIMKLYFNNENYY